MIHLPVAKTPSRSLDNKLKKLISEMHKYLDDGLLIAFSGGVDSAFLIWAARQALNNHPQGRVIALTTNSASMPAQDKKDAQKLTQQMQIEHVWRESKEMDNPDYLNNDAQRCYHCKTELFRIARQEAEKRDMKWIMYGYNASDISDTRPGHQAAIENNVLHPLADFGFSKEEIRMVLQRESIDVADKPASPCLSSRISHGIAVSSGKLADIAAMESLLHGQGVKVCRVRINKTGDDLFLRIEVQPQEAEKILSICRQLNEEGRRRGYKWVTMDLAGYRTGGGTE